MPEVDYSQFLYRRPVSPDDDERPEKHDRKKRNRKDKSAAKRFFVVFLCILLCFGITFCVTDFFSGGKLLKKVYALMVKPQYAYYLVCSSFPTREMAHAGVLAAESGGGAGYLLYEESYLVFYDVYFDKPTAETVATRNDAYFVYETAFSTSDTDLAGAIDKLLRNVSAILGELDAGTSGENALREELSAQKIIFSSFSRDEERKAALIDFTLACLDGIEPGITSRTTLLFRTRHALCSVLFTARDAFS